MKICGIKLTHDGAMAVVEDGELLFCYEAEKLPGGKRYAAWPIEVKLEDVLKTENLHYDPEVDRDVVDGWKRGWIGEPYNIPVAPHDESLPPCPELKEAPYQSYTHVEGHIWGAYCTSPFAARPEEGAWVLVWDGGQRPRLYRVRNRRAEFQTALFDFSAILYTLMGCFFGPYKLPEAEQLKMAERYSAHLPLSLPPMRDVPGKLMSFIALGEPRPNLVRGLRQEYAAVGGKFGAEAETRYTHDLRIETAFMLGVRAQCAHLPDADVLLAIHTLLEQMLVEQMTIYVPPGSALCFTGGAALNIKWNTALRRHYPSMWVPPFPNDSGSAIGAACAAGERGELQWRVAGGPWLLEDEEWLLAKECSLKELALLIYASGEPVVFLSGRAELGPRALGHRSILAPATSEEMQPRLNALKHREAWRPVAPVCLEERAAEIFDPGTPDKYMLFEHAVRPLWRELIPAIVHLDGTARLQTLGPDDDGELRTLLVEYERWSGVPVLCNTSANRPGHGFFSSTAEACAWAREVGVRWVWANGLLYEC